MFIKPTPINVIVPIFMIWVFWSYDQSKDLFGLGKLYLIAFSIVSIGAIIVDYFVQKRYDSYGKIFLFEVVILIGVSLCYSYTQRSKKLIVNKDFDKEYVTIVYGVDLAEPLPIDLLHWNAQIQIPPSGLLLTATDFETDQLPSKILTLKKEKETVGSTSFNLMPFINDTIEVNNNVYKFRSWKVAKAESIAYSSEEITPYKQDLRTRFSEMIHAD